MEPLAAVRSDEVLTHPGEAIMQCVALIGLYFAALVVFDAVVAPDPVASAPSLQTGTVTGIVKSSDGVALPGVQVTASSAALPGERTTVNGVYYLRALLSPGTAPRRVCPRPHAH